MANKNTTTIIDSNYFNVNGRLDKLKDIASDIQKYEEDRPHTMEENRINVGLGDRDLREARRREMGCCCYCFVEVLVYLILIVIIVPLLLLCCLLGCCFGIEIVRADEEDPFADLNLQFDTPEELRAYIESKLITRKVVAADGGKRTRFSEVMEDLSSREDPISSFVAAIRPPPDKEVKFSEPTSRSSSCPELAMGSSDEEEEEDQDVAASEGRPKSPRGRRRVNSLARSVSTSIRSLAHPGNFDNQTTCNICLLDYEVGEEVCWSRNDECVHAYHKECIIPWLMNNPTCPECRRSYLYDSKEEQEEAGDQGPADNIHEDSAANTGQGTTENV